MSIETTGFVDIQINGGFGHDFTGDPASIWLVGERLFEFGVEAFLPTIISSPPGTVEQALAVLAQGPPANYRGARPLGLHVEGPMLAPSRRGTHPEQYLRSPSLEVIEGWTAAEGVLMVTLAPELPGARSVVEALLSNGVVVALGHSAATYEEATAAFSWGITHVTHLFNAMPPLDHREPGPIGALFAQERVTAGLIVDGIHVHPATVAAAWRLLGPERLVLVTDAMAAAGLGDGTYSIGTVPVSVEGGRVVNAEGRLAGSSLVLDQAVRNLLAFTGCTESEAVAAATTNPLRVLGKQQSNGERL
ncbi:MAG TPA: N-acetylglucosamine-6-phosphate deacetylase [Acidimicrobiia bacterium]|nr:N-acetylglucosamine-6-phosphate deacetylase [Acidimicrobiia bacterium]